jgi:hypothetical protein
VVFLWPPSSCEPGGYYTVATEDGRFVGNVASGTRLEADLEPGAKTFVAWNPPLVDATGTASRSYVGILRATVAEGRTYFIRLAFGEWDERGPREIFTSNPKGGNIRRACTTSVALIALRPNSEDWPSLRGWLDDLFPIAAERTTGQMALEDDPSTLLTYRELAELRYLRMTPHARSLATLEPGTGVVLVPEYSR